MKSLEDNATFRPGSVLHGDQPDFEKKSCWTDAHDVPRDAFGRFLHRVCTNPKTRR